MTLSKKLTAGLRRRNRARDRQHRKTRQSEQRRAAHFESLEGRILLAGDVSLAPPQPLSLLAHNLLHPTDDQSRPPVGLSARLDGLDIVSGVTAGQTAGRQLVIVDPAVADYETLVQGLTGDDRTEILVLDAGRDGVEQISELLAERRDVAAVHVLAHGSSGSLQLGDALLSTETVTGYAQQLRGWASSLTTGADILLYGCNVAGGDWGVEFVEDLSGLTGADIAASSDLTGAAALGGDWVLEVNVGAIDSGIVFQTSALANYASVLPTGETDSAPGTSDWKKSGTPDDDNYTGKGGDDTIDGKGGNDTIDGGNGNDELTGGFGDDQLAGGAGDDTYKFANAFGEDTVTDTKGSADTLDFSAVTRPLTFSIKSNGAAEIFVSNPTDPLRPDPQYEDKVSVTKGIEKFTGGTATNTFLIGKGVDLAALHIDGPAGSINHLDFTGAWPVAAPPRTSKAFSQDIKVDLSNATASLGFTGLAPNVSTSTSVADVTGGSGDDLIVGVQGDATKSQTLSGGLGTDAIIGGDGGDMLRGDAERDVNGSPMNVGAGDKGDVLVGGKGMDTLYGGAGEDVLIGGDAKVQAKDGNPGLSAGWAQGPKLDSKKDIWFQLTIPAAASENDTLVGGMDSDTYVFEENWGMDVVTEKKGDAEGTKDTLDFSRVTSDLAVEIYPSLLVDPVGAPPPSSGITVTAGNDKVENVSFVERIKGGQGSNTYKVNSKDPAQPTEDLPEDILIDNSRGSEGVLDLSALDIRLIIEVSRPDDDFPDASNQVVVYEDVSGGKDTRIVTAYNITEVIGGQAGSTPNLAGSITWRFLDDATIENVNPLTMPTNLLQGTPAPTWTLDFSDSKAPVRINLTDQPETVSAKSIAIHTTTGLTSVNDIWTLKVPAGTAPAGKYELIVNGKTIGPFTPNAPAIDIQKAIQGVLNSFALPTFKTTSGTVKVTGETLVDPGYTIQIPGIKAGTQIYYADSSTLKDVTNFFSLTLEPELTQRGRTGTDDVWQVWTDAARHNLAGAAESFLQFTLTLGTGVAKSFDFPLKQSYVNFGKSSASLKYQLTQILGSDVKVDVRGEGTQTFPWEITFSRKDISSTKSNTAATGAPVVEDLVVRAPTATSPPATTTQKRGPMLSSSVFIQSQKADNSIQHIWTDDGAVGGIQFTYGSNKEKWFNLGQTNLKEALESLVGVTVTITGTGIKMDPWEVTLSPRSGCQHHPWVLGQWQVSAVWCQRGFQSLCREDRNPQADDRHRLVDCRDQGCSHASNGRLREI